LFRKQGLRLEQVSTLDRLSFIGHHGLGALTYEPDTQGDVLPDRVDMVALSNETALVLQGEDTQTLQKLSMLGGSPQGARPKVLVFNDSSTARISTVPMNSGSGWLVKFEALREHQEVCAIEAFNAQLARDCGLGVPREHTFLIWVPNKRHWASNASIWLTALKYRSILWPAFLHADLRIPSTVDYATFLRATRMNTRDEREVQSV
jgi:serine/threonine-protein kinase HipA